MLKQINWYEKGEAEVYDALYNDIDNGVDCHGFFNHLMQHYPKLDIDWLEIFEDIKAILFKEDKIDEILNFVEWYNAKFPEEYQDRYQFIEHDLCNYYLLKKDFNSLYNRIEFIQEHPVSGIDTVTKTLLFQLIYFGQYQQAVQYAKKVWKPIDESDELMGIPAFYFVNSIYINNLQEYYEAVLSKKPFDTDGMFKKSVALGFEESPDTFNDVVVAINSSLDLSYISSSIENKTDVHMLHVNIQFLKYMHAEYGLPFVFSETLWQFIATLDIFGKHGNEHWFFVDAETMDKHIKDSYDGFLGDNEIEIFGKVCGLQYITTFFFQKKLINTTQFQIMSENNEYFKNRLLKAIGINAWQMLFIFDWPKISNINTKPLDYSQLKKTFNSSFSNNSYTFGEYISTFLNNDRINKEIAKNQRKSPFFSMEETQPFVKEQKDIGRNEPCPCGSGKKYKKCCINK